MHRLTLAALMALHPVTAQAQADSPEMELQRCVWRCLAGSPGAASPAYDACVARQCSAPARWQVGRTSDGRGLFAGQSDAARGSAFYVLCAPGGPVWLYLVGPEGPSATLSVQVDGRAPHALTFAEDGGGYAHPVAPDSAGVLSDIVSGGALRVTNGAGWPLFEASLEGASSAIAQATAACR